MAFNHVLRVCTFNCCSLRKNIDLIRGLAKDKFDIIFLQETFLTEDKMGYLDFIDENYECIGVPACYSERVLAAGAGRPEGGMAFLWRKNSLFKIQKVVLENNFMIFNVNFNNMNIILVNVYMNSDIWEIATQEKYLYTLSRFNSILEEMPYDSIYFIGDFNADPLSGRAWHNLAQFMSENSLHCFDVETLPRDCCTFIGYGNSRGRWLDHVIGRHSDRFEIKNIGIMNDCLGSDHVPLEFQIVCKNDIPVNRVEVNNVAQGDYVAWDELKGDDFDQINIIVDDMLNRMGDFPSCDCSILGCRDDKHLKEINFILQNLIDAVKFGTREFRKQYQRKNKFKVIPGWNRRVKELHSVARSNYQIWLNDGKPLDSVSHENMLKTRKDFKKALNLCKMNENKEKCQSIVERLASKDFKQFWSAVRKQKECKKRTNVIEGESEGSIIAEKFANKFLGRTNEIDYTRDENEFIGILKERWMNSRKMHVSISVPTLKKIILSLNKGVGHDGLHSNYLKNASELFLQHLSRLINAYFNHCYLSNEILKGSITPTPKDTKANVTEMSNYRPVMQSSCLLKIIELHLLHILSEKINFDNRQFGFKRGASTTDACFILKEVISEYSKHKRYGFATFIDLSKAFDRVNHFKLGVKLISSGIPIDIVYILMHYFRNQQANVTWMGCSSNYSYLEEGVRQGGILSPFLFKLYVEDIIKSIASMDVGCVFGLTRINILVYADDIVLLAPSLAEMGLIYGKLCELIENLNLIINSGKTKCMCFGSKSKANVPDTIKLGCSELEMVTSYKYLGHIIEFDLTDICDIVLRLNKFYACTNSILRNFKQTDFNTLIYLFNSYCKPVYGLNLWSNSLTLNRNKFRTFEIAFNNTLKRILKVPLYSSNHEAAEECGQLLLRHHCARLQAMYYKRVCNTNLYLLKINRPFFKCGNYFNFVNKLFKDVYNVDVFRYTADILTSRIIWVQKHEQRRAPYILARYVR